MLYADDTGIVSRSSEGLERMVTVIVTACLAFGLNGLRGQHGDHVPADQTWGQGVVCHQHGRPGIQTNDRVCELGRGYQRTQRTQYRDSAPFSEGLGVLPAVQDGNILSPGCALTVEGAVAEIAEVIETLLYGCMTWSPNKADNDRLRRVHHSMLLRCPG